MDIEAEMIKEELQFEESIVCVKTESADKYISTYDVKAGKDVDIENQYQNNKILEDTIKQESNHNNDEETCETNMNTEKEKVVLEVKEESISDEMDEGSLPEIKTEELLLKNESEDDNSEREAHWDNHIKDQKQCDYSIYMKSDIIAEQDKNSIKKYGCDHCDYKSNFKNCLKRHILTKHDKNSIKRYGCDHCDFRTHLKSCLKTHIMVKHEKNSIKKYGCNNCDYRTHFKRCLNNHVIAMHDNNSIKKYRCDLCGYRAHQNWDLNSHIMAKHTITIQSKNITVNTGPTSSTA